MTTDFNRSFSGYIKAADISLLNDTIPEINIKKESDTLSKVSLVYMLKESFFQDDCRIQLEIAFAPSFVWSPYLTPEEGFIAAQHIFKTPALIARNENKTLILIPEVKPETENELYLDMDALNNKFTVGMSKSEITGHVLYKKSSGAKYGNGKTVLSFYLFTFDRKLENPFRPVLDFFWNKYGRYDINLLPPLNKMNNYTEHTYKWAFQSYNGRVFQEFCYNGKIVGAPVFIIKAEQSPSANLKCSERETHSIWNQAWFCSLRSASGLFRYSKRHGRSDLAEYALKTKELALSFKQITGLFDSVVATKMHDEYENGKKYWISAGWDTVYTGNSDRNPFSRNIETAPRHILDMSFTAYYMLIWYDELEKDKRLLEYAVKYAEKLISMQFENGYFPAWIDENEKPMGILDNSPESSMSSAFLFYLTRITGINKYADSAKKAIKRVVAEVVPTGRWEDFETYWSCNRYRSDRVGEKIERNNMYKQCNFSMYFTALALMESYKLTENPEDLNTGRLVLDELLMTQSSYQPTHIAIPICGGFGVMNCDAELNDARQSLFCELILEYGEALNEKEYYERGIAALRVSFSMMYCPENPQAKQQWEKVWPFFTEKDYGFNMENYGHDGFVKDDGSGIGEFTIYDWGNGAAAENHQRLLDHKRI